MKNGSSSSSQNMPQVLLLSFSPLMSWQASAVMWNAKNPPNPNPEAGPPLVLFRDEVIVSETQSGVINDHKGRPTDVTFTVVIRNERTGEVRERTRWVSYLDQKESDRRVRLNQVESEAEAAGIRIETSEADGRIVAKNVSMTPRQIEDYSNPELRASVLEELIRSKNRLALVTELNAATELNTIPEGAERVRALEKILESSPALALLDSQKRLNLDLKYQSSNVAMSGDLFFGVIHQFVLPAQFRPSAESRPGVKSFFTLDGNASVSSNP